MFDGHVAQKHYSPSASYNDSDTNSTNARGWTDLRSKIAELPEATREQLLALIASESGVDGMDLATEVAKTDPSSKVQAEVVKYLLFRRAERHAASLLAEAHDETWALLAKLGYPDEIRAPAASARLRSERDKALASATDPLERIRLLLEQSPNYAERDAGIAAAIADPRFPSEISTAARPCISQNSARPPPSSKGCGSVLRLGWSCPSTRTTSWTSWKLPTKARSPR